MITEFRIGCAKTINLGNYQSIRVEASVTVAVPEGDDFDVLRQKAQGELKTLLEDTYRAQMKANPGDTTP
jgi:hypothetical protein